MCVAFVFVVVQVLASLSLSTLNASHGLSRCCGPRGFAVNRLNTPSTPSNVFPLLHFCHSALEGCPALAAPGPTVSCHTRSPVDVLFFISDCALPRFVTSYLLGKKQMHACGGLDALPL